MASLFAQHFAAARSEWARSLQRKPPRQRAAAPADAGKWVYASVYFAACEDEVLRNLRELGGPAVSSRLGSECHHANGTALLVNFEAAQLSRSRCLLQPGHVASGVQERVVIAGMTGANRCTLRLPLQAFSPIMIAEGEVRFKRRKAAAVERSQREPQFRTLEALLTEGLEGMMLPLQDVGLGRKDLPYFLRGRSIHALQVDLASAPQQDSGGEDDDDEAAAPAAGPASSRPPAPRKAPAYENMCGSTFVYSFRMSPSAAFPRASEDCSQEVFSVYGNLNLHSRASGTAVSFKGAKDVHKTQKLVDCVVRRLPLEDDVQRQGEDDEYLVHMVVLTACIGKKVPMAPGNIATRTMHEAVAQRGGRMHYMPMCDDTCNKEMFQISGWDAIWRCCREARQWHASGTAPHDVDLSDASMPPAACKNTVTTSAKGSVIIRLSWSKPVSWTQHTRAQAANCCAAICMLLENCC